MTNHNGGMLLHLIKWILLQQNKTLETYQLVFKGLSEQTLIVTMSTKQSSAGDDPTTQ